VAKADFGLLNCYNSLHIHKGQLSCALTAPPRGSKCNTESVTDEEWRQTKSSQENDISRNISTRLFFINAAAAEKIVPQMLPRRFVRHLACVQGCEHFYDVFVSFCRAVDKLTELLLLLLLLHIKGC
jgi:hypothetical protein